MLQIMQHKNFKIKILVETIKKKPYFMIFIDMVSHLTTFAIICKIKHIQ